MSLNRKHKNIQKYHNERIVIKLDNFYKCLIFVNPVLSPNTHKVTNLHFSQSEPKLLNDNLKYRTMDLNIKYSTTAHF